MYQVFSNINETLNLQQYIDNKKDNKRIGIKSFIYTLGWYNIIDDKIRKKNDTAFKIIDGYYSFEQIANIFNSLNINLSVNGNNGKATIVTNTNFTLTKGLKFMLGFDNVNSFQANKTYIGDKSIDFATIKCLYIYLDQINTSQNFLNGAPSTLLAVIPIENKEFGDVVSVRFENPEFKHLSNGTITELNVTVRDENGHKINNHGLPMSTVLEII